MKSTGSVPLVMLRDLAWDVFFGGVGGKEFLVLGFFFKFSFLSPFNDPRHLKSRVHPSPLGGNKMSFQNITFCFSNFFMIFEICSTWKMLTKMIKLLGNGIYVKKE